VSVSGRHWPLVALFAAHVMVSACGGGKPAPAPYTCGDVTRGHCYSKAVIGDHLTGFRSTFTVVKDPRPGNGFVTNEFWLSNYSGTQAWIEIGYIQNTVEPLHYFWAVLDPDTTVFKRTRIADVPPSELGERVTFDIHQTAPGTFSLSVDGPTTKFATSVTVNLWSGMYGGYVDMGMELAGTDGATAPVATFVRNTVYDSTLHPRYARASDGAGESIGKPPYGGWLQTPTESPDGGVFITHCCSPS
jgi:hypothetical protein